MNKPFEIILDIRTESEANGGAKKTVIRNGKKIYKTEHWSEKNKRHKAQKKMVWWALNDKRPPTTTPAIFTLTRVAPRYMDEDNLQSSFKAIRDQCADYIHPGLAPGRADGLGDITFIYKQEKGAPKEYKIKIEISLANI